MFCSAPRILIGAAPVFRCEERHLAQVRAAAPRAELRVRDRGGVGAEVTHRAAAPGATVMAVGCRPATRPPLAAELARHEGIDALLGRGALIDQEALVEAPERGRGPRERR